MLLHRRKHATHHKWTLAALEAVSAIHVRAVGEHATLQRDRASLKRWLHRWADAVARYRRAHQLCVRATRLRKRRSSRSCFNRWRAHAEVAQERGACLTIVTRSHRRRLVLWAWRALTSNGFAARAIERWRARAAARTRARGFEGECMLCTATSRALPSHNLTRPP